MKSTLFFYEFRLFSTKEMRKTRTKTDRNSSNGVSIAKMGSGGEISAAATEWGGGARDLR